MRNLNNWVKSVLIQHWSVSAESMRRMQQNREGMAVLDLACGKGGDIRKWAKVSPGLTRYVGADIAKGSLEDFVQRIDGANDLRVSVLLAPLQPMQATCVSPLQLLSVMA